MNGKPTESRDRLSEVVLDEETIPRGVIDVDHERAVAMFDLVEENSFGVPGRDDGPYVLKISQEESKLTFDVLTSDGEEAVSIVVSMTPLRPLLKCDTRALSLLGPAAVALGEAEALHAHARSVAMRLEPENVGPESRP